MPQVTEQQALEALSLVDVLENPEDKAVARRIALGYEEQQTKLGAPLFPEYHRKEKEDNDRIRSRYTDKERHGFDDDLYRDFAETFPTPEERSQYINSQFLAKKFGKSTAEVRAAQPDYRDQYARQTWGAPVASEKEFADRLSADFAIEDEIGTRATKAALANVQTVDALSTFMQEKAEDPAFKGREKQRQDEFLRSVAQARSVIAPYSKTVDVVVSQLQEKTGVTDTDEDVQSYRELAATLLEIPEEDQETVLSAILARGAGEDEAALKGYAQKLGENFGRGLLDFTEGIPAFAERGQAMAVQRDIGAEVPAGKASTPEDYLRALAAKASGGDAYEQGAFLTGAMGKEFEAPSAEVKEQAAQLAEKVVQGIDLRAKIRSIAETGIDPATSDNRIARGFLQAARSLPYTLVAMAPGGGYVNAAAMAEQNYQALRAADPNLSREDAQAISAVSAPLQAFIERGQANLATGQLKALNKLFTRVSVTKGAVAQRFLSRSVATAGGEMAQENLQDATPFMVQSVFSALSEDVPGVDWKGQFGEMLKQQPDLFFATLPLALIGAGAGTVSDYKEAASMLANPKRIAATIGNTAKASEIASLARSGDLKGAQTMLREEFAKVEADSKPLQDVRREAVQALAVEAEQQKAAVERGEQIGVIPVVAPTKAGWMVRFNDKTEQTFPNYTEADAARWEHSGTDNFRFHEDITATISHADRTQREGQGVRYVFGQERKTLLDAKQSGKSSSSAALNRADEAAADAQVSDATIPTDEELKASVEAEYQEGTTVAEIKALSEDDRLAAFTILGENSTEFENGIFVTTAKLQAGATWATVIEEKLEGDAFVMLKDGRRDWLLQSLRDFEKIGNEPIFRPGIKDEEITDGDIKGAYARAGIAYFVGTADEQKGFQRGKKFKKRYDSLVAAGLSGSMEGYARFFMAVALRADALNKMRKEGALDVDLEKELARSVGYGEQAQYESDALKEAEGFKTALEDMGFEAEPEGVTISEATDDAPFSVVNTGSTGFQSVQIGDTAIEYSLSKDGETAEISLVKTPEDKRGNGSAREAMSQFAKAADDAGLTLFLTAEPMGKGVSKSRLESFYKSLGFVPNAGRSKDFRSKAGMIREPKEQASFSVITNADARIAEMFTPLYRNPEQRRKIVQRIQENVAVESQKFAAIARANRPNTDIERERKEIEGALFNEKLDTLSSGEIQALSNGNLLEDNSLQPILSELLNEKTRTTKSGKKVRYWTGSLMSKSEARRRGYDTTSGQWNAIPEGLPPYVWGGSMTPDKATDQFGFERPEQFFEAIEREILARSDRKREVEEANRRVRELEKEARTESRAWAEEQRKLRQTVGTDRKTLIAAIRTLDAMISSLPVEVRGKMSGFSKLATLVGPSAMVDYFENRVKALDRVLEKWLKDEATREAKEFFEDVKKKKKTKAGEKASAKALPEMIKAMDAVENAFKSMSADEGAARSAEITGLIQSGKLPDDDIAAAQIMAELIPLFSGWNGRTEQQVIDGKEKRVKVAEASSVAQKFAAIEAAKKYWTEGMLEYKRRVAETKERRDGMRTEGMGDVAKANTLRTRDEQKILEQGRASLPKKFALNIMSFDGFFRWHLGDDSAIYKWVTDSERKAANAYDDAVRNISKSVDDWFTKRAGSRFKGEQLRERLAQSKAEITPEVGEVRTMSQLEMITAKLIWRQEDGKRHMKGRRDEEGNVVSTWSYGDAFMEQIDAAMSDDARELMDFLSDAYDAEYEPLNKVYRKLFGIDLPKHLLYSPLTVKPMIKGDAGVDSITGFFSGGLSGIAGALKTRGTSIVEPDFKDALQTYVAHSMQMEHFKAYAEFSREARAIFGRVEFRDQIVRASGEEGATVLDGLLEILDKGGIRSSHIHLEATRTLEKLTGRLSTMILFGKLQTVALNFTQLAAASSEMGVMRFWKQFGKLWFSPTKWAEALRTQYIQRRIDEMSPVVRQVLESNRKLGPSRLADVNDKLGYGISASDGLFTAASYAMVYDWKQEQGRKMGLEGDSLEAWARNETERIVDRIAQPTRKGARSIFENTLGPEGRAFFNFFSEARKNVALVSYAAQKDRSKLAGTMQFILLNAAISSVIRAAWQDARDDDEAEDDAIWNPRKMILEIAIDPIYGIPVVGGIIQDAIKSAFGFKTFGGTILESGQNAIPAARRAATLDYSADEIDQIAADLNAILGAFGYFSRDAAALTSITNVVEDALKVYDNLTQ